MSEILDLNLILRLNDIDVHRASVLVMRHRPTEAQLQRILPWWAAEKPDAYNAYQSTQNPMAEAALAKADYLASFIAHSSSRAMFVGLYKLIGISQLSPERYNSFPAELRQYSTGLKLMMEDGKPLKVFDLEKLNIMSGLAGRLIVDWTTPRAWYRWADRNQIPVSAIAEESKLIRTMEAWDKLLLRWEELHSLPMSWSEELRRWRGVYYIFDESDRSGYVGAAYGADNILGRWLNYRDTADGGNVLLKDRDPKKFIFSVLQRVSPDADKDDVVAIESNWKNRLHTRTSGLNIN